MILRVSLLSLKVWPLLRVKLRVFCPEHFEFRHDYGGAFESNDEDAITRPFTVAKASTPEECSIVVRKRGIRPKVPA